MREFDDDLPYLFGAAALGEDLVMRLDSTYGYEFELQVGGVLEVRLKNCSQLENNADSINARKGEFVWSYGFNSENGLFSLMFEDGPEIRIECEGLEEVDSNFNLNELSEKLLLITADLKRAWRENTVISRKLMAVDQMLERELRKESGNAEEKVEFFKIKDPGRSDAMGYVIRLCTRLLNLKNDILRNEGNQPSS